ncbi:uncharacterized protein LOC113302969 [Papaver somniferum]|uniref:uncharacterized protein LOC113302969 n=1 Tax=Papaver somniferum TaxID=3469 RepID=UPI000E702802|nr:uncharacterized protein LOC113302969 [Papaver somniferum]
MIILKKLLMSHILSFGIACSYCLLIQSVLVIVENGYGWQLFLKMSQRNSITNYGCDLMLFGGGRMGETIIWSSHSKGFNASCLILIHNIHKYTGMTDLGLVLRLAAYLVSYAWECFSSNILSITYQQDVEYWVNTLPISIKGGISCYWCGSLSITVGGGRVYDWFDQKHMGVVSNERWNIAARYFIADTQQSLAQLLNSASDQATTIQVKEESANYIQLTNAVYDFWIIMHGLKVIVSEIFQISPTGEVCLRLQLQVQVKCKGPHAVFTNFNFQVETRGCEGTIAHTDTARGASIITYQAVSPDGSGLEYWPETMLLTVQRKITKFGIATTYSSREGATLPVFSGSFAHFIPSITEPSLVQAEFKTSSSLAFLLGITVLVPHCVQGAAATEFWAWISNILGPTRKTSGHCFIISLWALLGMSCTCRS